MRDMLREADIPGPTYLYLTERQQAQLRADLSWTEIRTLPTTLDNEERTVPTFYETQSHYIEALGENVDLDIWMEIIPRVFYEETSSEDDAELQRLLGMDHLGSVPAEEVVDHFGTAELLAHMDAEQVAEYCYDNDEDLSGRLYEAVNALRAARAAQPASAPQTRFRDVEAALEYLTRLDDNLFEGAPDETLNALRERLGLMPSIADLPLSAFAHMPEMRPHL